MNYVLTATTLLALISVDAQRETSSPPSPSGGDHLLYIGTYAEEIQIYDEATGRRAGEIKLTTGIPRTLILSQNRSKFYVLDASFEKVEVVDIATRRSISSFTLSDGNRHERIRRRGGLQVDPLERFLILAIGTATKLRDRWDIGEVLLQVYDLKQRKITRTIPWPGGEPRENMTMRFSPDGKFLYFFGDEVVILETVNFTRVDSWPLTRPLEQGYGRMTLGSVDDINDEPGFFTGLFTVDDPVQKRRIMGLGRVNLAGRSFEFTAIGPPAELSFALAPDRKRGYALLQEIGRYEFWVFDMEQKKLVRRAEFEGRPRMSLRVSSNGTLLYIFLAGATIDVYDAATLTFVRTIEMDADQTTNLFVLRTPAPSSKQ
jgi:hypothetical protein